MKIIQLPSGHDVLVDDADYEWLSAYPWRAAKRCNTIYASMKIGRTGKNVYMHRLILGAKPKELTDHKNGNGLDNQRDNIRIANQTQNQHNRGPVKKSSSQYKGVRKHKPTRYWLAEITVNKKKMFLGSFDSEVTAALAYDEAARRLIPDFAKLNFPEVTDYRHIQQSRRTLNHKRYSQR